MQTTRTTFLLCFMMYLSHFCMTCSPTAHISSLTVAHHCSFYEVYLEPRYHCGPTDYPLGFGKKYCLAFAANQDKFTPRGREWILDTMQCLQEALIPEAQGISEIMTCEQLDDYAFSTHPKCYIDNGFCTLPPSDWEEVVKIIEAEMAC
ncbi:hypothetical protein F5887DRAFT_987718 [Amanita rubescens]|nr:hypothetical protein F5887DRAFT_987718 [Amanita rubescens]